MTEEDEPSLLEYARFHGLTIDHRSINPLEYCSLETGLAEPELIEAEDSDLFEITAGQTEPPHEKLTIGKDALALLSSVSKPQSLELDDQFLPPKTHRIQDLKMELPLLRTDHELDMLEYPHRLVPDLAHEHLPFEKVEDEQDESLEWPSSYHKLPQEMDARCASEKLVISKDTIIFLQEALNHLGPDGKPPRFDDELKPYKRVRVFQCSTSKSLTTSLEPCPRSGNPATSANVARAYTLHSVIRNRPSRALVRSNKSIR